MRYFKCLSRAKLFSNQVHYENNRRAKFSSQKYVKTIVILVRQSAKFT